MGVRYGNFRSKGEVDDRSQMRSGPAYGCGYFQGWCSLLLAILGLGPDDGRMTSQDHSKAVALEQEVLESDDRLPVSRSNYPTPNLDEPVAA